MTNQLPMPFLYLASWDDALMKNWLIHGPLVLVSYERHAGEVLKKYAKHRSFVLVSDKKQVLDNENIAESEAREQDGTLRVLRVKKAIVIEC